MKCRNCKHPRWAEEYPGRPFFGWCDEINDSPDMDIERECRCFEPATNADVIRRMSDEELVVFFDDLTCLCVECNEHDGVNENCPIHKQGCGRYCEPKDLLNWLQQTAEEDT